MLSVNLTIITIIQGTVYMAASILRSEGNRRSFCTLGLIWRPSEHDVPVVARRDYRRTLDFLGEETLEEFRKMVPQVLRAFKEESGFEDADQLRLVSLPVFTIEEEKEEDNLPF